MSEQEVNVAPSAMSGVSRTDPIAFFVTGELDMAREGEIVELVKSVEIAPESTVDMDMSEVTFVDSAGLRALLQAKRYLSDRGCSLRLVNPHGQLVRIIKLTGIDDLLKMAFKPTASSWPDPTSSAGSPGLPRG